MALERLLKGFSDFHLGYYREHLDLFEKLATEGQSPKILIVACADARVDPGILTQTKPGDSSPCATWRRWCRRRSFRPTRAITARRRPSSSPCAASASSMSWCWGTPCAAASALWSTAASSVYADYDYLSTWTSIAQDTRDLVVQELKGRPREEIARAVEQAAVLNSVSNLMSFRWIAEKVEAGTLVLHAWWFNMTEGQLYAFNPDDGRLRAGPGLQGRADRGHAARRCRRSTPERFVAAVAGRKPAF